MIHIRNLFLKGLSKNAYYKKQYFVRLLITFTVLSFVIVISTTSVFTGMYIKNVSNQLYVDYNYSLSRLANEFDNIFIQLTQESVSLKQNSDINNYLYGIDKDYDSISRADIFLSTMKNLNNYLDSIILYNRSSDFVISSGILLLPNRLNVDINTLTKGQFAKFNTKSDLNMVSSLMNPDVLKNKKPLKTVSLIFSDNFDGDSLNNGIIMTIDPIEINKKLMENYDGITLITDDKGNIVFYPYNYEVEDNISSQEYFKKIVTSEDTKNYFTMKVDNDDKIITYTKSYKTGFNIINMRSLSGYSDILRAQWISIAVIGFIIILFFSIASYFLSRKMYNPIRSVTELFSHSGFISAGNCKNEMDLISNVYHNAINRLNEIEVKSRDNCGRLKEEFFKIVLKSCVIPDSIKNEMKDYDFNVEFSNLIHVCIVIDNRNTIDDEEMFILETTLCKTIPELLMSDFNMEIVNFMNGEIALLLNFKNNTNNSFETLVNNMDKLRNICRETLKITLTIGIGGAVNSLEECFKAYKKADEMTRHRFVLGFDKTIYDKYLDEVLTSNIRYPVELEDQIISAIKLNRKDLFEAHIKDLTALLCFYPYSEAVTFLLQIITACLKTFNQVSIQDNQKYSIRLDEFSNILSKFQTVNHAGEWLLTVFENYQQMIVGIMQLKSNKHFDQILKAQEYIKNNYTDINLSADSISEVIGYSPYYFTKVFKDITGMNVNDYIRQIRIDNVKQLLSNTDYKINQIAGMTGFTNASHFFAVFKKDVGLTPLAYREYALENKKSINFS